MKKRFPVFLIFTLLILLVSASLSCIYLNTPSADNGDTDDVISELPDTAAVSPPVINSFAASPGSIETGETSTLSWSVTGASSASIDQGIGSVALNGSRVVNPAATTVYTLLATNAGGSITVTAQVIVSSPLPPAPLPNLPVIDTFELSPVSVVKGNSSSLSWSTSNAASVTIDQGIGTVAAAGSKSVSPTVSTVYTITATNSYGWVSRSIALTVTSSGGVFIPPLGPLFIFKPDLIITDVWSDGGVIWYTVKNQGIIDAPATHTRLLIDGVVKATDYVGALSAGAFRNEKFTGYAYACGGLSDVIELRADADGECNESDETNNTIKETWICKIFFEPLIPLIPGP